MLLKCMFFNTETNNVISVRQEAEFAKFQINGIKAK